VKSSELLRMLRADGWFEIRQRGSHKIMRNPTRSNELVFPDHGNKEVPKGLYQSILKQAGLK